MRGELLRGSRLKGSKKDERVNEIRVTHAHKHKHEETHPHTCIERREGKRGEESNEVKRGEESK